MFFTNTLGDLSRITNAETRSISSENPTGAKGVGGSCPLGEGFSSSQARDLGLGWKVNPCTGVAPGETLTLCRRRICICSRHGLGKVLRHCLPKQTY